MNASLPQQAENHAQRVIRLQGEYKVRYLRFRNDLNIEPLIRKLLLMHKDADNSLSETELIILDKKLEPLRQLKARFERIRYRA